MDITLLRDAYIDKATAATDRSDAQILAQLRIWRDQALSDYQSGVQITSVSFAGESQSGQITAPAETLLKIAQAAIHYIENGRNEFSGVTEPRFTGYVRT